MDGIPNQPVMQLLQLFGSGNLSILLELLQSFLETVSYMEVGAINKISLIVTSCKAI